MRKDIKQWLISEYTQNTEKVFPLEHFGLGDKLLLYHVAKEMIELFDKNNASIRSYAGVTAIRCEMQDRFGYIPKDRPKEWI